MKDKIKLWVEIILSSVILATIGTVWYLFMQRVAGVFLK